MIVDKGLDPSVADKISTFVLQSGPPKDLWEILTKNNIFGDHLGNKVTQVNNQFIDFFIYYLLFYIWYSHAY